MRRALIVLALGFSACSSDPTAPGSPDATITVAAATYFVGYSGIASVKNNTDEILVLKDIGCGNQVQKQDGPNWSSLASIATQCNFVGIPAGETASFAFNIPANAGGGTYRVATVVRKNSVETPAYSNTFTGTVPPFCASGVPAPCINR